MKKGDLVWNYSIEVPGVVTKVWRDLGHNWISMLCFDDGTLELANDLEVVPLQSRKLKREVVSEER